MNELDHNRVLMLGYIMSRTPQDVFMCDLEHNYENSTLDAEQFIAAIDSSLQHLSQCIDAELHEIGSGPGAEGCLGQTAPALVWTKRLRHALSQAFEGSSQLCTELLELVHFGIYNNGSLGLVILQQLRCSLAEGPGGSSGATSNGEHSWGFEPAFGHVASDGDILLGPLGPLATDLPLAASIYSACPDGCGHAALQAVVVLTQRCSQQQLSSWFAAYSAAGLTRVTEWLLEAALGWLSGPLDKAEAGGDGSNGSSLVRQDGSPGSIENPGQAGQTGTALGAGGAVGKQHVQQQQRQQHCSRARCGAVLLAALAWSCPQLARSVLAVVLDRLGTAGESGDEEESWQQQEHLTDEENVFDVRGMLACSDAMTPAHMGVGDGHGRCYRANMDCSCDSNGGSPLWEVLQAITGDMARVLKVQDHLMALEAGPDSGPPGESAACTPGSDRGRAALSPRVSDSNERIRLVSELCGDDVDLFEHLLIHSLELLRLMEEHTPFVTSMRPSAAVRFIRLLSTLLPHSEYMVETLLLGATLMAGDAAAAAEAADAAAEATAADATVRGAAGLTSPTHTAAAGRRSSPSRLTVTTPGWSFGGFDYRDSVLLTPGLSQASHGTARDGSPAVSSLCSAWLMHQLGSTPGLSSGTACDSEAVSTWPRNSVRGVSLGPAASGAAGTGDGNVLPVTVGLALEVLCAVLTNGRRLPSSLAPLFVKLLDHLLQLARRRSPLDSLDSSPSRRSHCTGGSAAKSKLGPDSGAASLAPGVVATWVLARLQAALMVAADTSSGADGAGGADLLVLCADALAAALRAGLYSDADAARLSPVWPPSPSQPPSCAHSEPMRHGGAGAPPSPQMALPRLRPCLRHSVRWLRAFVGPSAGRAARRRSLRDELEEQAREIVLAAPPVAALVGSLGQALAAAANRDDVDPRGRHFSSLRSPANQALRADFEKPITALAELLIVSVFGDGRSGVGNISAVGNKPPGLASEHASTAAATSVAAEAAVLLQLRMQIVGALVGIMTRVPDYVSLAVLVAAAPLLPQRTQRNSPLRPAGPCLQVAVAEPDAGVDGGQHVTSIRVAVTEKQTVWAAAAAGGITGAADFTCNLAPHSSIDLSRSSARPSGAFFGTVTGSEAPARPCAAATQPGLGPDRADTEAALAAAQTVTVGNSSLPSVCPYGLTAFCDSHEAGERLQAAQETMRTAIVMATCSPGAGSARPQQPLSQVEVSAVALRGQRLGGDFPGSAADHCPAGGRGGPRAAAMPASSSKSSLVSAALAALLACHNALHMEQGQMPPAAEPAPRPTPKQKQKRSPKAVFPSEHVTAVETAGPSHAAAGTKDAAADPAHHEGGDTRAGGTESCTQSAGFLPWQQGSQSAGRAVDSGRSGPSGGFFVVRRSQPPTTTTAITGRGPAGPLKLGSGTPVAAVAPQSNPALSAGLGSRTPRSSPLEAAQTAAVASGMAIVSSTASSPPILPCLNTWPVSLRASTELLRRLLGREAAPPPALPPPSLVQRWHLVAYAAGLAQRALLAAAAGHRGLVGCLPDGLVMAGQVAVDVAEAAQVAQEAISASDDAGGDAAREAPLGSTAGAAAGGTAAHRESGKQAIAAAGGGAGARQSTPAAPAAAVAANISYHDGKEALLPTGGPSLAQLSLRRESLKSPLASQESGLAAADTGGGGQRAMRNGPDAKCDGQGYDGGHGGREQGPHGVRVPENCSNARQAKGTRLPRALIDLTSSLSIFTAFDAKDAAAHCEGGRRSRRSCGSGRGGGAAAGARGGAAGASSTPPAPQPTPTPVQPPGGSPLGTSASQQPAPGHGGCVDGNRKPHQTPQTKDHTSKRAGSRCAHDAHGLPPSQIQRAVEEDGVFEMLETSGTAGLPQSAVPCALPAKALKVGGGCGDVPPRQHPPAPVTAFAPPLAVATPTVRNGLCGAQASPSLIAGAASVCDPEGGNAASSLLRPSSTIPHPHFASARPESCVVAAASEPKFMAGGAHYDDQAATVEARRLRRELAAAASSARAQALHLLGSIARVAVARLPLTRESAKAAPPPSTAVTGAGPDASAAAAAAGSAGGRLAAACSVLRPLGDTAASHTGDPDITAVELLEPLFQRLLPPAVADESLRGSLLAAQPELGCGVLRGVRQVIAARPLEAVPVYLLGEAWRLALQLQQLQAAAPGAAAAVAERPVGSAREVDALVALAAALPVSGADKGPPYKVLVSAAAASCQRMLVLPAGAPLVRPVAAAAAAAAGTSASGTHLSVDAGARNDRIFSGPALRRLARLSCRGLEPYAVLDLAAQLLVALPKALSCGGGRATGGPPTATPRARHGRRWRICPYVQRAAAIAGPATVSMLARTMMVAKGRPTAGGGTATASAASSTALDAVPLWLLGCTPAQVAQVLLQLAAAVHPTVVKASGQVAAAGSTERAGGRASRMACQLKEVPDAVATILGCAQHSAALLLSPSRRAPEPVVAGAATDAAADAAPGGGVTDSVQQLRSSAIGARDPSVVAAAVALEQQLDGHKEAEEERHRLLAIAAKQLLAVTKCATACTWLLLRLASTVAAHGGALGGCIEGRPAGARPLAVSSRHGVTSVAAASVAAAAAEAMDLLEAVAADMCLVLGLWLYHAKDLGAITEMLRSSRSRTLRQRASSLGLAGAACQTVWLRLIRFLTDAAVPPLPPQPPQAGPGGSGLGLCDVAGNAVEGSALPGSGRAALLALARVLRRAFERVRGGGKGTGALSPSSSSPSSLFSPPRDVPSPGGALCRGTGVASGQPFVAGAASEAAQGRSGRGLGSPGQQLQDSGAGGGLAAAFGPAGASEVGRNGMSTEAEEDGEDIPHEPLFLLLGHSSDEESGGEEFGDDEQERTRSEGTEAQHADGDDTGADVDMDHADGERMVDDNSDRGGSCVGARGQAEQVKRVRAMEDADGNGGRCGGAGLYNSHSGFASQPRRRGMLLRHEAATAGMPLETDEEKDAMAPGLTQGPNDQQQHEEAQQQQRQGQQQQFPSKRRRLEYDDGVSEAAPVDAAGNLARLAAARGLLAATKPCMPAVLPKPGSACPVAPTKGVSKPAADAAAQATNPPAAAAAVNGLATGVRRRRITPSVIQLRVDPGHEHGAAGTQRSDPVRVGGGGSGAPGEAAAAAGLQAKAGGSHPEPYMRLKPAFKSSVRAPRRMATTDGDSGDEACRRRAAPDLGAQGTTLQGPDTDAAPPSRAPVAACRGGGSARQKQKRSLTETGSVAAGTGSATTSAAATSAASRRRPRKQARRKHSPRNAFIAACLQETFGRESDSDGDWSDLEDFIVCQPERDYKALFAKKYYYAADEEDEEEDGEGGGGAAD